MITKLSTLSFQQESTSHFRIRNLLEEDARNIELIVTEFENMGVETVAPTHCSGPKTEEIFGKGGEDNKVIIHT